MCQARSPMTMAMPKDLSLVIRGDGKCGEIRIRCGWIHDFVLVGVRCVLDSGK